MLILGDTTKKYGENGPRMLERVDSFYPALTLDTNILIAHLGGEGAVSAYMREWRVRGAILFVSSISECELLSYPKLSPAEETKIERLLKEHCVAFPFDGDRARKTANIRRVMPSLKLPDAAIAALALEMHTPLVTRNIRDFKRVAGLSVIAV